MTTAAAIVGILALTATATATSGGTPSDATSALPDAALPAAGRDAAVGVSVRTTMTDLDDTQGRLDVRWQLRDDENGEARLSLDWRESGRRASSPKNSAHRGFGRFLLERALPRQLSGQTRFDLHEDGLHCRIELPLDRHQAD